MTGCIYHEADLDGVMSAAIVKKYFKGDIDLLPYNYGKEIPDVNKYDKVFVVDVSFGDRTRFLFDEWEDKGIDVTWIDHHKTAIEAVKDYNVKGKRRIGTAACELTWEYLFDDIETPDVVKLLSAYDVWDHDRFEWSDVLSFQYGMRGYCGLDVDMVREVLNKANGEFVSDMIRNGEAIIEYIIEKNRGEMKMFSFEADIFGYKAICMNTTEFNSTTFESMYDPRKHDLMMPFCWNGRFFRCSFYTTKKEVDVSALARKANPCGGGHKAAAGFQLSVEDMMGFLKERRMEGWKKYDSQKFYTGLLVIGISIIMIFPVMQYNMENMKNVYKFNKLNEMKLDDYGFGLFEYNGALYFKEADEGRCFDVRSGNEVIIGKDKIVTVLED